VLPIPDLLGPRANAASGVLVPNSYCRPALGFNGGIVIIGSPTDGVAWSEPTTHNTPSLAEVFRCKRLKTMEKTACCSKVN
jgi:hypothetical protein